MLFLAFLFLENVIYNIQLEKENIKINHVMNNIFYFIWNKIKWKLKLFYKMKEIKSNPFEENNKRKKRWKKNQRKIEWNKQIEFERISLTLIPSLVLFQQHFELA